MGEKSLQFLQIMKTEECVPWGNCPRPVLGLPPPSCLDQLEGRYYLEGLYSFPPARPLGGQDKGSNQLDLSTRIPGRVKYCHDRQVSQELCVCVCVCVCAAQVATCHTWLCGQCAVPVWHSTTSTHTNHSTQIITCLLPLHHCTFGTIMF